MPASTSSMAVIKNSASCHLVVARHGARRPALPTGLGGAVSRRNEGIRHVNVACLKNSGPPYK